MTLEVTDGYTAVKYKSKEAAGLNKLVAEVEGHSACYFNQVEPALVCGSAPVRVGFSRPRRRLLLNARASIN